MRKDVNEDVAKVESRQGERLKWARELLSFHCDTPLDGTQGQGLERLPR